MGWACLLAEQKNFVYKLIAAFVTVSPRTELEQQISSISKSTTTKYLVVMCGLVASRVSYSFLDTVLSLGIKGSLALIWVYF